MILVLPLPVNGIWIKTANEPRARATWYAPSLVSTLDCPMRASHHNRKERTRLRDPNPPIRQIRLRPRQERLLRRHRSRQARRGLPRPLHDRRTLLLNLSPRNRSTTPSTPPYPTWKSRKSPTSPTTTSAAAQTRSASSARSSRRRSSTPSASPTSASTLRRAFCSTARLARGKRSPRGRWRTGRKRRSSAYWAANWCRNTSARARGSSASSSSSRAARRPASYASPRGSSVDFLRRSGQHRRNAVRRRRRQRRHGRAEHHAGAGQSARRVRCPREYQGPHGDQSPGHAGSGAETPGAAGPEGGVRAAGFGGKDGDFQDSRAADDVRARNSVRIAGEIVSEYDGRGDSERVHGGRDVRDPGEAQGGDGGRFLEGDR